MFSLFSRKKRDGMVEERRAHAKEDVRKEQIPKVVFKKEGGVYSEKAKTLQYLNQVCLGGVSVRHLEFLIKTNVLSREMTMGEVCETFIKIETSSESK